MSDRIVILVSAAAGVGVLLLLWSLMYLATGRFYPFGVLISIGAALLIGMRLKQRWSRGNRD